MEALERVLLELMWEGRVTNDTSFPLRSLGKTRSRRGRRPPNAKYAGGRWSLVEGLLDPSVSETERAHARVTMLLERYGLVSRAAAQFEEIPGGYGSIYPVLREMEERGRLRRGHFVEGLAGSQFALAGAVERLRAHRHDDRNRGARRRISSTGGARRLRRRRSLTGTCFPSLSS